MPDFSNHRRLPQVTRLVVLLCLPWVPAAAGAQVNAEPPGTLASVSRPIAPTVTRPVRSIGTRSAGRYYYYRPETDYGSAAVLTPLGMILNRGFSVIQLGATYPRDPRQYDWAARADGVMHALRDPDKAVRRFGGWRTFVKSQIIPFGTPVANHKRWAWTTNYSGHVVAGGISYRHTAEWLAARGRPYPRLSAGLLYWGTQFINETIEQTTPHGTAATVADLYIFDTAAILVFNIDAVARFFSETVRSHDWSPLASITLPNGEVQNNGQHVVHKIPLPWVNRVEGFWRLGMGSQAGLSLRLNGGHNISPALGIEAVDRRLDPVTLEEEVDLEPSYGFYWDRDDSLMASIVYVPNTKNVLTINVYPGVLPGYTRSLGFWLVQTQEGDFRFGIGSSRSLGLGFGYGR